MRPRLTSINIEDVWRIPRSDLSRALLQQLSDKDFNELLRRVTKEIRRPIPPKSTSAERLNQKRFARHIKRRLVRLRQDPNKKKLPPRLRIFRKRASPVLDAFYPGRRNADGWTDPVKRKKSATINLDNFSFVDRPTETMQALRQLAEAEATSWPVTVNFNDARCLDIGSYLVLAMMREAMAPVLVGGRMLPGVQHAIHAVALREFLAMAPFKGVSDQHDIWAFKVRRRASEYHSAQLFSAFRVDTRQRVVDQLVDAVNSWLKALPPKDGFRLGLAKTGMRRIGSLVGELLDNAERHSDSAQTNDGVWWIAGFMERREDDSNSKSDSFNCHLAIINTGQTISATVDRSEDQASRDLIEAYCDRHASPGPTNAYEIERLRLVCALQDGVSRFSLATTKGGVGLMDMIEFVNELGDSYDVAHRPRITIISGSACVKLCDNYVSGMRKPGAVANGSVNPRLLWFNPDNAPEAPPDPRHAFTIEPSFPGTIVAMRFELDHQFLRDSLSKQSA